MKSLLFVAIAAITLFVCGSYTSKGKQRPIPHQAQNLKTAYYFYFSDNDSFDQYAQLSAEITHLEDIYQTIISTDPFGGTLVANGYTNNLLPHNTWPVELYAH